MNKTGIFTIFCICAMVGHFYEIMLTRHLLIKWWFFYCYFFKSVPLSGIYLLLFTIQVLGWQYCWTTLGLKIIQKKCPLYIYFFFHKNNNLISISGRFFVFSIYFVIGPISYQKNNFKILNVYILVKRPLEKLYLHPQWGPDTHNSPHQRGAVSKAEQAPFVQKKNHFKNYQKLLNFWLD